MHWIAPSEKENANGSLEERLWDSADQFRANPGLKAQEYSGPVLGSYYDGPHEATGRFDFVLAMICPASGFRKTKPPRMPEPCG